MAAAGSVQPAAADATLTLHLPKPGLRNLAVGALWLADLGIPGGVTRRVGIAAPEYSRDWILQLEREEKMGPE